MPVSISNHHHNSKEGVLMIINTNIGSATAARILGNNTSELQKSLKRLSTGSKIASISDDSAGVAVAGKMSAEIKRIEASRGNVANLISFSQTQAGYHDQISDALNRMSELAMLATDATKTTSDRTAYSDEFTALKNFINDIGGKTFNTESLFSSTQHKAYLGLDSSGSAISFTAAAIDTDGIDTDLGQALAEGLATTAASAAATLTHIQDAVGLLATERSQLGANLSRLEQESRALSTLKDNLSQARSRIIDVDVAEESANFAKQQILVQSGTAMLAQANIIPQSALRLIN
jgi:flagellin